MGTGSTTTAKDFEQRRQLRARICRGLQAERRRARKGIDWSYQRIAEAAQTTVSDVRRALDPTRRRLPSLAVRQAFAVISREWPDPVRMGDW